MDQLKTHQESVKTVLEGYVNQFYSKHFSPGGIETTLLLDDSHEAYAVLRHGWEGKLRVQHVLVFIRLVNEQIWIEEDWTDYDFAGRLLEMGVAAENIILAFHHPQMRQYADVYSI